MSIPWKSAGPEKTERMQGVGVLLTPQTQAGQKVEGQEVFQGNAFSTHTPINKNKLECTSNMRI